MTSPVQKEHGHSPIAHPIIEALAAAGFSASQYAVLLVLIRETYGWSRRDATISLGAFAERTRAHKTTVQRALESLIAEGVVIVVTPATFTGPATYRLQKDPRQWGGYACTPPSLDATTPRERAQAAQTQGGSADANRGVRVGANRGVRADATSQRSQLVEAAQITEPENKGKQEKASNNTGDKSPDAGASPDERTGDPPPPERDATPASPDLDERKALHARIAPLIREHAWLGTKAPPRRAANGKPWGMGNELSIAKRLVSEHGLDEVCGAIETARAALGIPPGEPFTLALFLEEGKRHRLQLAMSEWRARQMDDGGGEDGESEDVVDQFLRRSA